MHAAEPTTALIVDGLALSVTSDDLREAFMPLRLSGVGARCERSLWAFPSLWVRCHGYREPRSEGH